MLNEDVPDVPPAEDHPSIEDPTPTDDDAQADPPVAVDSDPPAGADVDPPAEADPPAAVDSDPPADADVDPPAEADVDPSAEVPAEGPEPRRRGPLWAKLLVGFGTALVVLASGTVVAALLVAHRYDHAVHRADLLDSTSRVRPDVPGAAPPAHIVGPLNFLLLGSDARPGDTADGERSDTIIIVHVPASMDRAYLISVPRDLRVHIPADPTHNFPGSTEKINGAFNYGGGGVGGFQLVSRTLTELTGLRFDGAGIIDFVGFQKVVALLGGVDMCVDQETKSIHTKAVYHVGCQHLAPWQALDYVRQRELLPEGDYDRQRHQQQFLQSIYEDAKAQGLVHNPLKLDQVIRSVGDSLIVDTNGVSLIDLVLALRGIQADLLSGIRVPSYPEMIGGISYVLAYDQQATTLYQAIAADRLDDWIAANPTWVNHL